MHHNASQCITRLLLCWSTRRWYILIYHQHFIYYHSHSHTPHSLTPHSHYNSTTESRSLEFSLFCLWTSPSEVVTSLCLSRRQSDTTISVIGTFHAAITSPDTYEVISSKKNNLATKSADINYNSEIAAGSGRQLESWSDTAAFTIEGGGYFANIFIIILLYFSSPSFIKCTPPTPPLTFSYPLFKMRTMIFQTFFGQHQSPFPW
jgi:hypothetical protein